MQLQLSSSNEMTDQLLPGPIRRQGVFCSITQWSADLLCSLLYTSPWRQVSLRPGAGQRDPDSHRRVECECQVLRYDLIWSATIEENLTSRIHIRCQMSLFHNPCHRQTFYYSGLRLSINCPWWGFRAIIPQTTKCLVQVLYWNKNFWSEDISLCLTRIFF